jgi:hypothetical protein
MNNLTPYQRELARLYDLVNAQGGVPTNDDGREQCRAIDDVMNAIEALQADTDQAALIAKLEGILAQLRQPYNGFVSPQEASKPCRPLV